MNKSKKKRRNRIIAIVMAFLILAGALGYFIYMWQMQNEKILELETTITENTQTVYVAAHHITAGEQLTTENTMMQTVTSGLEAFYYISAEDLGSFALVDIEETVPIMTTMVTSKEFDQDSRDYEIRVANLMTDQANYDIVDFRIMFPNGEDYLILPKKTIVFGADTTDPEASSEAKMRATCTTVLNEEEILRIASATIDAYLTTGAYIYTTRYVASAQDEAIPNYLVRAETLDLMTTDPNVLTEAMETLNLSARLSLEARLAGLTEEELEAVVTGHGIADYADASTTSSTSTGMASGVTFNSLADSAQDNLDEDDVEEDEDSSKKVEKTSEKSSEKEKSTDKSKTSN